MAKTTPLVRRQVEDVLGGKDTWTGAKTTASTLHSTFVSLDNRAHDVMIEATDLIKALNVLAGKGLT